MAFQQYSFITSHHNTITTVSMELDRPKIGTICTHYILDNKNNCMRPTKSQYNNVNKKKKQQTNKKKCNLLKAGHQAFTIRRIGSDRIGSECHVPGHQ